MSGQLDELIYWIIEYEYYEYEDRNNDMSCVPLLSVKFSGGERSGHQNVRSCAFPGRDNARRPAGKEIEILGDRCRRFTDQLESCFNYRLPEHVGKLFVQPERQPSDGWSQFVCGTGVEPVVLPGFTGDCRRGKEQQPYCRQ